MAIPAHRVAVRTVRLLVADLLRLALSAVRTHGQLAAENLFLRKQLALYRERQVKPRRADDVTWITLVVLSWLIDWRRVLTVVKQDTLVRWHRQGFSCSGAGSHGLVDARHSPPTCSGSSVKWRQPIEPGARSESHLNCC
jgi:hypothetical protein